LNAAVLCAAIDCGATVGGDSAVHVDAAAVCRRAAIRRRATVCDG
jgi:hypothetical protein